ncbi:MAG TPA: SgcJ/EcaC family oxidoreductase [Gemmatimonadaceae bacterium]|nr:SgcJ/EcaC family oxidoreductase [Gemmatimonadaceae bacterium]
MRSIVLFAVFAAGLTGAPARARAQGTQADQAAVSNLAKQYEAAFAKGDARAVAALYTTNGILTDASGVVSVGRSEIEKTTAADFARQFKGATLTVVQGPTVFLRSDVAVGRGTFEIRSGTNSMVKGMYLVASVKRADGWHIAAHQNMVPAPPPPSGKAY